MLAARRADIVIVFAIRVEGEGFDSADLSLPWGQDAVIDAVAAANPNTVVVLETGNPVAMPWRESVNAIVQAWYPGQAGGQAIAEIIAGQVNPSGRLPITFPVDLGQTPRPELPGLGAPLGTPTTIDYIEGAEVGYRWFAQTGQVPMFAFGHGLSYTSFEYHDLVVSGGDTRPGQLQRHQHRRPQRGRRPAAVLDRRPRRAMVTVAGIRAGRAGARARPAGSPSRRIHACLPATTAAQEVGASTGRLHGGGGRFGGGHAASG